MTAGWTKRRYAITAFALVGLLFMSTHTFGGGVDLDSPSPEEAPEDVPLTLVDHSLPPGLKTLTGVTEHHLDSELTVQVLRFGAPAPGEPVSFRILVAPSGAKGQVLTETEVVTDDEGMAHTEVSLGSKKGDYVIGAFHDGGVAVTPARIPIRAKGQGWMMFLVFGLLGGLGIFLIGMEEAGDGLKQVAGDRMRSVLSVLTSNRFFGLLMGAVVTGILQSSSVTTVMLVGFVSATMMTLVQAVGVIMGAKIGTTVTAQIVAFNVSEYALAFVALGFGLRMAGWNHKVKQLGGVVLGFGFIFFGLGVMSTAMKPLRTVPEFTELLLALADQPILAILLSIAFTAVVQSSSATIGLIIALCAGGLLTLEAGLPLAWGAHIGTCATALLSSLGAGRAGKQVAIAHLVYSVITVVLAFPFLHLFVDAAHWATEAMGSDSVARQVANGHTVFTVATGILFLPFVKQITWLTRKIIPDAVGEPPFGPRYINDNALSVPVLALEQAHREVLHMAGIARDLVGESVGFMEAPTEEAAARLRSQDDKLDILERTIRPFLARVAQEELSPELSAREHAFIYFVQDLESIGDLVSKELGGAVAKLASQEQAFSDEGLRELKSYQDKLMTKFEQVIRAIEDLDRGVAEQVIQLGFKERLFERKLREAHLDRLHSGREETVATSSLHLSVLSNLRAISDRLEAIARNVMMEL